MNSGQRRASARILSLSGVCFGALSLVVMAPAPAIAQGAQVGPSSSIGEVVVTARKREESLIETPVAVTVFSADAIQAQSIANLSDIGNATPNVSFTTGNNDAGAAGSAVIFIRGIGQNDYANSTDPGVGTYIDGVYIGRAIGGLLDLPDVAQVEVLRGPQGTLFGKNTMGGAINITTTRPGQANGGAVAITAGEDNRLNADVEGDLRMSDKVGFRGVLSYRSQDGFVERLNGGDAIGAEERLIARVKAEFQPTDALNILLSADYTNDTSTSARVASRINPNSARASFWNDGAVLGPCPICVIPAFSVAAGERIDSRFAGTLRTTNANGSYDNDYDGGGVSARVDYGISDALTLRSITAHRTFDSVADADQDGQRIDFAQQSFDDVQHQISQEFNLISTGDRFDWIFGVYYFGEDAKASQEINLAYPIIALQNNFSTETQSKAVFGEGTYRFSDQWSLTAGLRYTKDEKDYEITTLCRPDILPSVIIMCTNGDYLPRTTRSADWDTLDPRVILQFQPTETSLIYASYSTGFKSGGFNARPSTASQVGPYDPETVDSYEIGAKTSAMDGRLLLSGAAFFYNYEDYQVTVSGTTPANLPVAVVGNVGTAEVFGVEGEVLARPTDYLTLNAGFGYTNAEYSELSPSLTAFFDSINAPASSRITLDDELPKTPKWTVNAGAEFRTPVGGAGAELRWRADWSWVDDQFSEARNFTETRSPAHHNLNGRITYVPANAGWTLALYGKNITDEEYIVNGFYPDGGNGAQVLVTPNEPREIGVQLRYEFGG